MKKTPLVRNRIEVDASNVPLGRLATRVATLLRGKHKASYQPHIDAGDIVVVKNIAATALTGDKLNQKVYYHYSGYLGGMKERKLKEVWPKDPAWVFRHAVLGMLDENRLRAAMMKRLIIE